MADMSKVGDLLADPGVPEPSPAGDVPEGDDPEAMGEQAAGMFADAVKSGDAAGIWSAFKMLQQAASAAPEGMPEDAEGPPA